MSGEQAAVAEALARACNSAEKYRRETVTVTVEDLRSVLAALAAATPAAQAEAMAAVERVRALFVDDYEPCDLATWSCDHVECEVAVAVLAALAPTASEGGGDGAVDT